MMPYATQNGGYLRVTASVSYIVWLDFRPTARYAESDRRGRVNRVRSVVADEPQNLGVIHGARPALAGRRVNDGAASWCGRVDREDRGVGA